MNRQKRKSVRDKADELSKRRHHEGQHQRGDDSASRSRRTPPSTQSLSRKQREFEQNKGRTRWNIDESERRNSREDYDYRLQPTNNEIPIRRSRERYTRENSPVYRPRSRSPVSRSGATGGIRYQDECYERSHDRIDRREKSPRDMMFDDKRISSSRNGQNSEIRQLAPEPPPIYNDASPQFLRRSPAVSRNSNPLSFRNAVDVHYPPEAAQSLRSRSRQFDLPPVGSRRAYEPSVEILPQSSMEASHRQILSSTQNGYELELTDLIARINAAERHIEGVTSTVRRYEREINKLRVIVEDLVQVADNFASRSSRSVVGVAISNHKR